MSEHSRRTVVRGAAWSVPVIAVAAQAPAFATSHTPPPPPPVVIQFSSSCGNNGNANKGCGGQFTLQVPLTLSNPTNTAFVFQLTAMYVRKDGVIPAGPGTGTIAGIRGIFRTPDLTEPNENNCTSPASTMPPTASNCTGGVTGTPGQVTGASILVAANSGPAYYWIESRDTGSADDFTGRIEYKILNPITCLPIGETVVVQDVAQPSNNCNG